MTLRTGTFNYRAVKKRTFTITGIKILYLSELLPILKIKIIYAFLIIKKKKIKKLEF